MSPPAGSGHGGLRGFDPTLILRALVEAGVRFVLIGGWAAKLHGSPTVTADIDICYARDPENLERLAVALAPLDVRLRGVPEGLPFRLDSQALRRGDTFTLETRAGDLDLIASPAGVESFDALAARADALEIEGLTVAVTSLDDLVRMKRAAGRPKDRIEVEILEALRDEASRG